MKVMKSFALELPDDPDVREMFEGIAVMNTGHVALRFRDVSPDGVVKRVTVLRELADGIDAPSMLGIPVALGSGLLMLSFSREGVTPIPEEFAKLFDVGGDHGRGGVRKERREPFHWIAWNDAAERICDCGSALASSHGDAFRIATACFGGPHAQSVVAFEIVDILSERQTRRFFRIDGTEIDGLHDRRVQK